MELESPAERFARNDISALYLHGTFQQFRARLGLTVALDPIVEIFAIKKNHGFRRNRFGLDVGPILGLGKLQVADIAVLAATGIRQNQTEPECCDDLDLLLHGYDLPSAIRH